MCPLRVILLFLSALLAGYFAFQSVTSTKGGGTSVFDVTDEAVEVAAAAADGTRVKEGGLSGLKVSSQTAFSRVFFFFFFFFFFYFLVFLNLNSSSSSSSFACSQLLLFFFYVASLNFGENVRVLILLPCLCNSNVRGIFHWETLLLPQWR
jgi:hypothetical protein